MGWFGGNGGAVMGNGQVRRRAEEVVGVAGVGVGVAGSSQIAWKSWPQSER